MKYICRKYQHPLNPEAEQLLDMIVSYGNFIIDDPQSGNRFWNGVAVYLDDKKEIPKRIRTTCRRLSEEIGCLKNQLEQSMHSYENRCAVEGKQAVPFSDIINHKADPPREDEELADLDILRIGGLFSRMERLQKLLEERSSLKPDEEFELQTFYSLLGYYNRNGQNGPEVVLLMETLGNQPYNKWRIATTFVHEMIHAIYDHNKIADKQYLPKIEEPLTEYATLKFCMNFIKAHHNYNQLYEYALRDVLSKQVISGISHYGFGYFLHCYEQYYNKIIREEEYRYCDWETVFSDVIYQIHKVPTISIYESFFEGWRYPFEKEGECMKVLYKVLFEAKQLNMRIKHKITPPCYLKDEDNLVLTDNEKTLIYCRDTVSEFEVPQGIRTIGKWAFYSKMKMRKVTLPNSVRVIKAYSFQKCRNLEYINIPEGIRVIQGGALSCCKKLKSISLPNTLNIIQRGAFSNCPRLETVKIPRSVHTIYSYAFASCSNLKDIKLPLRLGVLGEGAFQGCSSLLSIKIPGTVYIVRESTFKDCLRLKQVEIGEGIISIEKTAFSGCNQLESIKIPRSVKWISILAFAGCDHLKEILFSGTKNEWEQLTADLPISDGKHIVNCIDGKIIVPEFDT